MERELPGVFLFLVLLQKKKQKTTGQGLVLKRGDGTCSRRSSIAKSCFLLPSNIAHLSYENLNTFVNKTITFGKYIVIPRHGFLLQIQEVMWK